MNDPYLVLQSSDVVRHLDEAERNALLTIMNNMQARKTQAGETAKPSKYLVVDLTTRFSQELLERYMDLIDGDEQATVNPSVVQYRGYLASLRNFAIINSKPTNLPVL